MDAERFDGLAKTLARNVSRRRLMVGLLGGVAGLGLRGRGEAPALSGSVDTLAASASVTVSDLPHAQCPDSPPYPGAGSGTIRVSGLTQAWCVGRGGHFLESAGTCGDATTLCGEFAAAWARSCITCQGVFHEAGCVPCLF